MYARGKALITTHIAIPGCPYIVEKIADIYNNLCVTICYWFYKANA